MPWESLGTIAPISGEWRTFQGASPPATGAAVFRVTPKSLGVGVIFKTYALVRFRSVQDGEEIVTRTQRVYPRAESMVIEADIPKELRGSEVQWYPQVKKQVYRNFIGSTNDGSWLIEIEHLLTDVQPDPVFVELGEISEQLDNLTNASEFLY